jgi:two-component system chemotaxis sensor kinase CheA
VDDFERELKVGFLDEAESALTDVEQSFLTLESNPNDEPTLDKIFRLAHNLKGSSKAVGFDDMGAFTHDFESLLLKVKNKVIPATSAVINLLLRCNDHLVIWVQNLKQDLNYQADSKTLLEEIQKAIREDSSASSPVEEVAVDSQENVPSFDLDPISEDLTDVLSAAAKFDVVEPEPVKADASAPQQSSVGKSQAADESIRVSTAKLEKLLNYVGEMVILQSVLREQVAETSSLLLKRTVHQLGKVSKEVQDISMSLRMVPIRPTFQKMNRIVRDTAQALGKEIHLKLQGEETELDKTVLERINDPLVHLIRNSVDHGIESVEKRVAAGKPSYGQVTLSAFHQSGRLIIEVKDDGGGIDPQKIKAKAIEKGIIKPGSVLSDKECINLIFAAGFSTKEQVTDVSGRGVGMDVVRTNIEDLQGEISIESNVGRGSTFRISLPLTLAIIEGMVVRCGTERFVIPLNHIHESLRPEEKDIQFNTGFGDLLLLRKENLPLYNLAHLFGRKSDSKKHEMIAIVIRTGKDPFAFLVDDIIGQFQVVIKQLGPELAHLRGVSGSTILGDGKPALIVEPEDLVKKSSFAEKRRTA